MLKFRGPKQVQKQQMFELLKTEYFNFWVNCRFKWYEILFGEMLLCYHSLISILNGLIGSDSVWEPFYIFRDSNFSRFESLFGRRNLSIAWDLLFQTDLDRDFCKF